MGAPDLSEFEALVTRAAKRPCQIAAAKEGLDPTDCVNLDAALATAKELIPATAILGWLKTRERDGVSVQGVASHRRGECACYVH